MIASMWRAYVSGAHAHRPAGALTSRTKLRGGVALHSVSISPRPSPLSRVCCTRVTRRMPLFRRVYCLMEKNSPSEPPLRGQARHGGRFLSAAHSGLSSCGSQRAPIYVAARRRRPRWRRYPKLTRYKSRRVGETHPHAERQCT